MKNCNSCYESINENAIKCKHCGSMQLFHRSLNLVIFFGSSFLTISSILLIAFSVSDIFIDKSLKSELLQVDEDMVVFSITNPSDNPKYIYGVSGSYLADVSDVIETDKTKESLSHVIRKPVLLDPKKSLLYKVHTSKESINFPPMPPLIKYVILRINNMNSDENLYMNENSDCSIWLIVKEQDMHAIEHKYRCINSNINND